jgi:hypothetical protein
MLSPGEIRIKDKGKVYTSEISPLITLATNKKSAEALNNSHLVLRVGESFHEIRDEIARWGTI